MFENQGKGEKNDLIKLFIAINNGVIIYLSHQI